MLRMPFDSDEARDLNKKIFSQIYRSAVEESSDLAAQFGSYESFAGSPASQGKLQPHLWGNSDSVEFDALGERVKQNGLRNSLLVAPMPTASTSQILGYNECIEPFTSNIYTRRTLAGEYIVVNRHLIQDLVNLGLWDEEMKQRLMFFKGSVQKIPSIPEDIKQLYKTAWELKQKTLLDQAAERGPFICQSQSLNVFVENPSAKILNSIHFYGWAKGLKTGTYYIRSKPASSAQNFSMDPTLELKLLAELSAESEKREATECLACAA